MLFFSEKYMVGIWKELLTCVVICYVKKAFEHLVRITGLCSSVHRMCIGFSGMEVFTTKNFSLIA